MHTSSSHRSNTTVTSALLLDSRALCVVCGAPAIGRNFDAHTCLSCKAFFRRNAYNEHIRFACRVLGSCEITVLTRRHCSACRLNKCFQQGMRKELIRSLVAIKQATSRVVFSRRHHELLSPRLTLADSPAAGDPLMLLVDDWTLLNNMQNAYEEYCAEPFLASHQRIPLAVTTQPYRSRVKLQRLVDLTNKYLAVIVSFVKRILELDGSPRNDYEYVKGNLPTLLIINVSVLMKSNVLQNVPWEYDRCLFESVLTESVLEQLDEHLHVYNTCLPYDALIMKLFLIVLALSSRTFPLRKKERYYSADFHPFPKRVVRAQNRYLVLLWKYATYRWGPQDAVIFCIRFTQHFLRRQRIDGQVIDKMYNRDDHGQLLALFKAEINIS